MMGPASPLDSVSNPRPANQATTGVGVATPPWPAVSVSRARAHPWIAIVLLIGVFSVVWPYDLHNRADREAGGADLKALVSGRSAGIEEGHSARRVAIAGLALLSLVLLSQARRRGKLAGPGGIDKSVAIPAIAFMLFAAASLLWADEPALIARRIVVFLAVCFAAWAVACTWRLSDILLFILVGCGATLLLSVAVEVRNHVFTPFDGTYRLSGLTHPNTHAVEAGMVVIAGLVAARLTPEHRRAFLAIAAGGAILLVFTRSRTALLSIMAALSCASYFVLPRKRVVGIAVVCVAAALIVGVFVSNPLDSAKGALLMGRQQSRGADVTTLSGRVQLWRELFNFVKLRPLTGYGFDSFWSAEHMTTVSLAVKWAVPEAHSGYLDMVLSLGVIGLALFCIVLAAGLWQALRRLFANRDDIEALYIFTVFVWLGVETLSETVVPQTHYGAFLVMVLLAREAMKPPPRIRERARAPAARLAVSA